MAKRFNVNTDRLIGFTNNLQKLHRSAFPVAVRQTLNSAAFETKRRLPMYARKSGMVNRMGRANIFKNFSEFRKADGWKVDSMCSSAGIYKKSGADIVAEGMATQEKGGTLKYNRDYIPTKSARENNNYRKPVRADIRTNKIRTQPKKVKKGDYRRLFAEGQRAMSSPKNERFIMYGTHIVQINEIKRSTGKNRIDLTPIYRVKKGNKPRVKRRDYLKSSALNAEKNMERNYVKYAKKQFRKYV